MDIGSVTLLVKFGKIFAMTHLLGTKSKKTILLYRLWGLFVLAVVTSLQVVNHLYLSKSDATIALVTDYVMYGFLVLIIVKSAIVTTEKNEFNQLITSLDQLPHPNNQSTSSSVKTSLSLLLVIGITIVTIVHHHITHVVDKSDYINYLGHMLTLIQLMVKHVHTLLVCTILRVITSRYGHLNNILTKFLSSIVDWTNQPYPWNDLGPLTRMVELTLGQVGLVVDYFDHEVYGWSIFASFVHTWFVLVKWSHEMEAEPIILLDTIPHLVGVVLVVVTCDSLLREWDKVRNTLGRIKINIPDLMIDQKRDFIVVNEPPIITAGYFFKGGVTRGTILIFFYTLVPIYVLKIDK